MVENHEDNGKKKKKNHEGENTDHLYFFAQR